MCLWIGAPWQPSDSSALGPQLAAAIDGIWPTGSRTSDSGYLQGSAVAYLQERVKPQLAGVLEALETHRPRDTVAFLRTIGEPESDTVAPRGNPCQPRGNPSESDTVAPTAGSVLPGSPEIELVASAPAQVGARPRMMALAIRKDVREVLSGSSRLAEVFQGFDRNGDSINNQRVEPGGPTSPLIGSSCSDDDTSGSEDEAARMLAMRGLLRG